MKKRKGKVVFKFPPGFKTDGCPQHVSLPVMEQLLQQIETHKREMEGYTTANFQVAENFRIKYLGTKGIVKSMMAEMKNIPAEKRKEFGQVMNDFKVFAEAKYETLKEINSNQQSGSGIQMDLSLPGDSLIPGS
ncbi:MAG: hypothetical protein JST10_02850, partial [Bacteroidetes bacterium]|nr:hypothetical protein [Bacteroidota bacterium]